LIRARGLLAVDLDGTLLDRSGRPHPRDARALRAAVKAGVRVSIVTGRLYSGTRMFAEAIGLTGPVGCADGSHLVRAHDHATLLHLGVIGADALRLRDALAGTGVTTFVLAKDAVGHDDAGAPFVGYVSTWSTDVRASIDVYRHDLWEATDGVTAAVSLGTREQVTLAAEQIARELAHAVVVVTFPVRRPAQDGTWALMARALGGTKGTALRWIAEHEGIDVGETVCVGDWMNDLPMFEAAGRSFAMGQAPDEVKAKATDVLAETVETGGGVARVISEVYGIAVE
jgi:Cof subfamily protein (haloacid dehalogenase superfamily)